MLQSKLQLSEDEESVPDVSAAVQEILATIFTALYNHQDEEGRCYSDSMAELPEHDVIDGKKYEYVLHFVFYIKTFSCFFLTSLYVKKK